MLEEKAVRGPKELMNMPPPVAASLGMVVDHMIPWVELEHVASNKELCEEVAWHIP